MGEKLAHNRLIERIREQINAECEKRAPNQLPAVERLAKEWERRYLEVVKLVTEIRGLLKDDICVRLIQFPLLPYMAIIGKEWIGVTRMCLPLLKAEEYPEPIIVWIGRRVHPLRAVLQYILLSVVADPDFTFSMAVKIPEDLKRKLFEEKTIKWKCDKCSNENEIYLLATDLEELKTFIITEALSRIKAKSD